MTDVGPERVAAKARLVSSVVPRLPNNRQSRAFFSPIVVDNAMRAFNTEVAHDSQK
ncbi:hypothetical protein [Pseudomonas sp. NFACC05-1]|uniref:hypothetical protein n=1 Tax=Pseudomonas sp. NFACC05-1 TaxID=1566241 RepID=UPI0015871710|nr:hypothetical protein [Pseudomonas sp. NFACC05-1]